MKLDWESLDSNDSFYYSRAKIPNGWLYKCTADVQTSVNTGYDKPENMQGYEWRVTMTFVPDNN